MYIKFNHNEPNITFALGITPSIITETDKTLVSLAHLGKPSLIVEKALEIFKNNDLAIAYIFMKVGFNIAETLSKIEKPNTPVEE